MTESTTNVEAMEDLNANFDSINDQLPADVDGAVVSVAGTQTITNKTLTAPTITNPTVSTGTFTDPTLVAPQLGTPDSGNLSNCTFPTLNQDTTWYASALKSATTTVSVSAATAPTSGQALVATSTTTATWQNSGYWDFYIKLWSDFTVTNSSTLTDVTGFSLPVVAGEAWYIELMGTCTASDTTWDIKADVITTGTWATTTSFWRWIYWNGAFTLTTETWAAVVSTTASLNSIGINNWDSVARPFNFQLNVVAVTSGNIKFQIANVSAAGGRTSTIKAGTYMLARKLST